MKATYSTLVRGKQLNHEEMFDLKGGFSVDYGCESNVCATQRSGASKICTDAYCRSGVGPESPKKDLEVDPCRIWTRL